MNKSPEISSNHSQVSRAYYASYFWWMLRLMARKIQANENHIFSLSLALSLWFAFNQTFTIHSHYDSRANSLSCWLNIEFNAEIRLASQDHLRRKTRTRYRAMANKHAFGIHFTIAEPTHRINGIWMMFNHIHSSLQSSHSAAVISDSPFLWPRVRFFLGIYAMLSCSLAAVDNGLHTVSYSVRHKREVYTLN